MSWTRSAKKENGGFDVTVWDYNGIVFFKGEFSSIKDADYHGQLNERKMMIVMQYGEIEDDDMSIEDILKELDL